MAFKFYLDGQLTDQPMNDKDLSTSVIRDKNLGNLTITQDVEIAYNGNNLLNPGEISGYAYLNNKFFTSDCESIQLKIYDQQSPIQTVLIYQGLIKVPSIKIDLHQVIAKTKVQDNGYYSYINNNRGVPVNLAALVSKSDIEVTPINLYQLDIFNSVNGVYYSTIGSYRHGYRVYDAFDIIIRSISDNNVTFQSTFLSNLTDVPFISSWRQLRYGSIDTNLEVTFEKLFDELNKIYNLFYYIDDSDPDNPVLRIEEYNQSFGNGDIVYSFDDLKELDVSFEISNYYSNIQVGSDDVTTGSVTNYPFVIESTYQGWVQQTVFPQGQCNINSTLDLVNSFVIHNNSIQDVVIMQTDDYQDKLFLIACENVDTVLFTAVAKQYDPFNAGDTFYNDPFSNIRKLTNHAERFTSDLGSFLATGQDNFRALMGYSSTNDRIYQGVGSAFTGNLMPNIGQIFQSGVINLGAVNESTQGGFDDGGNYSNTLFEYTIPADGVYSFAVLLRVESQNMTLGNEFFKVTIYNNVGNPYDWVTYINGNWVINYSFTGTFTTGQTVFVEYNILYYYPLPLNNPDVQNGRNLIVKYNSFFECNGSPVSGLIASLGDQNVKKYIYEFDYEIPQGDFLNLKPEIFKVVSFEKDGVTRLAWIDTIKRNDWTGISQIKLITNNASITQ